MIRAAPARDAEDRSASGSVNSCFSAFVAGKAAMFSGDVKADIGSSIHKRTVRQLHD
jgi:hypothetical protein